MPISRCFPMGVAGHGSKRDLLGEIVKIRAGIGPLGPPSGPYRPSPTRHRRRVGEVSRAIAQVLADSDDDLTTAEIRAAVERLLGEPVRPSTIKNCLARSAARGDGPFRRVSRGRYRFVANNGSGPRF